MEYHDSVVVVDLSFASAVFWVFVRGVVVVYGGGECCSGCNRPQLHCDSGGCCYAYCY